MARPEGWAFALLVVIGVILLLQVKWRWPPPATRRVHPKPSPRRLKPRTPDDCPECRAAQPSRSPTATLPKPYSQVKNPRGRKKRIVTVGYACPDSDCLYYGITDDQVHALVGCGGHPVVCPVGTRRASGGQTDPIQDFFCQACHRKFSARRHTALTRLTTPQARIALVLHAVAEGLSAQAAARVFHLLDATVHAPQPRRPA